MLKRIFILTYVFILISCKGLDNDEKFIYRHRHSFFLNSKGEVFRVHYSDSIPQIFHMASKIADISLFQNSLVSSDSSNSQWVYFSLSSLSAQYFSLNTRPVHVFGFQDYLIYSDDNQVFIEHKKKKTTEKLQLDLKCEAIYANQNRAWLMTKNSVVCVDLTSGAVLEKFTFSKNFDHFTQQWFALHLFFKDSSGVYTRRIDTNGLSMSEESKVDFEKIYYPTNITSVYETEYLKSVQLSNGKLNISGFDENVESYHVDFQTSKLFFTRNDSLFYFDIRSRNRLFLKDSFGKIMKGIHHYSQKS